MALRLSAWSGVRGLVTAAVSCKGRELFPLSPALEVLLLPDPGLRPRCVGSPAFPVRGPSLCQLCWKGSREN